jgi:hypothetical protein
MILSEMTMNIKKIDLLLGIYILMRIANFSGRMAQCFFETGINSPRKSRGGRPVGNYF